MRSTDKFIMRFLLFLCISSVFINIIYITNILTTTEHRLAEENDLTNGLLHENRDVEIFGSTGHLFTGEKTRRYEGKRASFSTVSRREKDKILQLKTRSCTRWGVVTTVFDLSESITKVGRLADSNPSWCLVIVLDKNGKKRSTYEVFTSDRIVILDVSDQQQLSKKNEFVKKLPWRHFSRKNIGYYYAISQGAEVIFDFDDDNLLYSEEALDKFVSNAFFDVMESSSSSDGGGGDPSFNPYPFMKVTPSTLTWPRGLPLDKIKQPNEKNLRHLNLQRLNLSISNIGVIQSLADHDPDVDAVYRLTQPLPLNFEEKQKLISVPKNKLAPFNAQATIWMKEAFFGLLLPVTVHGRVSDIWRSYIVGRLLEDHDLRVIFSFPLVKQERNPHNYLKDFQAELPLYLKSSALVSFLRGWKSRSLSWYERLEELMIDLYEREFVELEDVEVFQFWIQELLDLGLEFKEKLDKKERTPPSCLFDPFCWTRSTDWKFTDPPPSTCDQRKSLRFYDFNIHDGVMMDHSNLIEHSLSDVSKVKHEVFHWNYKKSEPASSRSAHSLKNAPIKTLPLSKFADDGHAEKIWNLFHDNRHFLDADALIFGFLPADFQFFLQFNKSIIIDAAHRVNLLRCSIQETLATFQTLKNMKESTLPRHVIGAHYLYDVEYIRYYTGISAILLPATQLDSINDKYNPKNSKIFVNGHVNPVGLVDALSSSHFELVHSDSYLGYSYKSISEMKAVVYLPYSISNYKFIDHYAMNIPIFSPSPEFAVKLGLYVDRTVAGNEHYCPEMSTSIPSLSNVSEQTFNPQLSSETNPFHQKDELFWIKFAEVYRLPCINLFNSWEELLQQLLNANFIEISSCTNQANKWRRHESLQNWCWATHRISGPNGETSRQRPRIIINSSFLVQ